MTLYDISVQEAMRGTQIDEHTELRRDKLRKEGDMKEEGVGKSGHVEPENRRDFHAWRVNAVLTGHEGQRTAD